MRAWPCLSVAALLCPEAAFATGATEVLDLRGGAVGELTGKTLGLAHGLLAFLLVLGLVVELARGPGQKKHYLAVVWRTLVVLALLQAYGFLAGSVVKQCTSLAEVLAPRDSVEALLAKYRTAVTESFVSLRTPEGSARLSTGVAGGSPAAPDAAGKPDGVGGFLFDAVLALVLLLAQALQWVFTQLSRILIGFFYAIGPLALVFYVPGVDAPGRWLRHLVTVSCWPLVSALLLHLATSVLTRTNFSATGAGAVFGAVASSLLLCVLACATPKIASALVGGAGNLVSEGASAAVALVGGATWGGALSRVARGTAAVAAGAGRGAPADAGGSSQALGGRFSPAHPRADSPARHR
jgi:hypothetical protein